MPKNADPYPGSIRIIAGQLRGRKIDVPLDEALRPTGDRMRETLFNWLQFDISGATCLDLCAGTGILGFEALSRGAAYVTFVEQSPLLAAKIRSTAEHFKLRSIEVLQKDVLHAKVLGTTYDIVFMDPPFSLGLIPAILKKIEVEGWLNKNAHVFIESEPEASFDVPADWHLHRELQTRGSVGRLYKIVVPSG